MQIRFFIITFACILGIFCVKFLGKLPTVKPFSNKFSKIKAQELQLEFSFPKEDEELLLAYPSQMEVDEEGNIYICDGGLSSIIKYTRNGKLLKVIGRKGKGPGEFINQHIFCYDQGKLFISDRGRIQILDKEGNYLSSFKIFRYPWSLSHFEDRIFAPLMYYRIQETKDLHLISIFNEKGRVVGEFGEFLKFMPNIPDASHCLLKIYGEKLYVLFVYFPILRVYSVSGQLLQVIEFEELKYAKRVPGNYKVKPIINPDGTQTIPLRFLFRAFDVTEEGIFVGLYDPDIIIDRFDFDGKFIQRFKRQHKTEEFYLFDFKVFKKNENELEFYILNQEEVPKVDVCIGRITQ